MIHGLTLQKGGLKLDALKALLTGGFKVRMRSWQRLWDLLKSYR